MYRRILVPIDGSATAQAGLDEALRLARISGGSLRLLHVVDVLDFCTGFETPAAYARQVLPHMRSAGQRLLAEATARAVAAGVTASSRLCESGDRIADLVFREAAAWGADLVVIGTHGRRGIERLTLGSNAEQIARDATLPVLLVRCSAAARAGVQLRAAA